MGERRRRWVTAARPRARVPDAQARALSRRAGPVALVAEAERALRDQNAGGARRSVESMDVRLARCVGPLLRLELYRRGRRQCQAGVGRNDRRHLATRAARAAGRAVMMGGDTVVLLGVAIAVRDRGVGMETVDDQAERLERVTAPEHPQEQRQGQERREPSRRTWTRCRSRPPALHGQRLEEGSNPVKLGTLGRSATRRAA